MKLMSQETMWMVSGLSLMLLVGCNQDDDIKPKTQPTLPSVISMKPVDDKKMVYGPEKKIPEKKLAEGKKPEAKEVKAAVALSRPDDSSFVESDTLKPVKFALHHSQLDADGKDTIEKNAAWLKTQPPYLVQVVGIADPRGSFAKNKRLAERRAMEVRTAYVAQGIPAERVLIAAKVMDDADCAMPGEDCFTNARRADTKIEHKALAQR